MLFSNLKRLLSLVSLFLLFCSCGYHSSDSFGEQKTGAVTRVEKSGEVIDQAADAIQSNQLPRLQELLGQGLPVNSVLRNGRSLLIEAVVWGRIEIVAFLIERGAQLDLKDPEGRTALDHAQGKPALLRLLNPQTERENQELFAAVNENRFNDVKSLVLQGVDPNVFSAMGETPLTLAVGLNFENVVRVLLQQTKTDVNLKNKSGESPLGIARIKNLKRIEDLLKRRGAKE